jgi:hypothetical protein
MKLKLIIMAIALTMASQVFALDQPVTPFTSSIIVNGKKTYELVNPLTTAPKNQNQRRQVEGLSTSAWATTVGWNSGASAFSDERTQTAHFNLLWFGAEPPQY